MRFSDASQRVFGLLPKPIRDYRLSLSLLLPPPFSQLLLQPVVKQQLHKRLLRRLKDGYGLRTFLLLVFGFSHSFGRAVAYFP